MLPMLGGWGVVYPGFNPWSGSYNPHAATKSFYATSEIWCSQISKYIRKKKDKGTDLHLLTPVSLPSLQDLAEPGLLLNFRP